MEEYKIPLRNKNGEIIAYSLVDKDKKRYIAYVSRDGVRHHLGNFETPEDVAKARDLKAIELYGTFAKLNFPII